MIQLFKNNQPENSIKLQFFKGLSPSCEKYRSKRTVPVLRKISQQKNRPPSAKIFTEKEPPPPRYFVTTLKKIPISPGLIDFHRGYLYDVEVYFLFIMLILGGNIK